MQQSYQGPLWGIDSAEKLRWQVIEGADTAVDDAI